MDGSASVSQGPLRPIPVHCQRPAPASLDPLLGLPPPPVGLDLRMPWKPPVLSAPEKSPSDLLSSVHALPYPYSLFEHLRRQHCLMTSDRLAASVTVPRTSPPPLPVIGQTGSVTSPIPGLPAPVSLPPFLPLTASTLPRRLVEERMGGGGPEQSGCPRLSGMGVPPAPPPLITVDTPNGVAISPYGRKLFPCPQCRYTTDRRNNLKRHLLTMHQVSAKMLECCGVLFRTKAALREHALIFHYHGYTCFYCGRRFCRKALLKRHLSVHNGQKEFLCNVCDYATSHKSNLERHRRVHARQDGDKENDDDVEPLHDDVGPLSDDVRSNTSESNSHVDVSCDELSVCSDDDEDEEINVHSD